MSRNLGFILQLSNAARKQMNTAVDQHSFWLVQCSATFWKL